MLRFENSFNKLKKYFVKITIIFCLHYFIILIITVTIIISLIYFTRLFKINITYFIYFYYFLNIIVI